MFGTLTVSAAENDSERVYWESVLDSSFGRQVKTYIQKNYSDYKYIAVRTENNHKYGIVYLSDCPFYEFKKLDDAYYSVSCYNKENVNCRYVVLNYRPRILKNGHLLLILVHQKSHKLIFL